MHVSMTKSKRNRLKKGQESEKEPLPHKEKLIAGETRARKFGECWFAAWWFKEFNGFLRSLIKKISWGSRSAFLVPKWDPHSGVSKKYFFVRQLLFIKFSYINETRHRSFFPLLQPPFLPHMSALRSIRLSSVAKAARFNIAPATAIGVRAYSSKTKVKYRCRFVCG